MEGTNNVLKSVDKAGINRFVQTSSVAAIQKYNVPPNHIFTENDWNDWSSVEKGDAYGVAKTQAEQIVHAHFADDEDRSSIAVNPGVVIGPVLSKVRTKASAIHVSHLSACTSEKKPLVKSETAVDRSWVSAPKSSSMIETATSEATSVVGVRDSGEVGMLTSNKRAHLVAGSSPPPA